MRAAQMFAFDRVREISERDKCVFVCNALLAGENMDMLKSKVLERSQTESLTAWLAQLSRCAKIAGNQRDTKLVFCVNLLLQHSAFRTEQVGNQ